MSAETALRRAKDAGVSKATIADMEKLFEGLDKSYPALGPYFEACKRRPYEPGWAATCHNRYRRFYYTDNEAAQADQERQCMNFGIQGGVADTVNTALFNFRDYRRKNPHLKYRIALQVHDDIVLFVPYAQVEEVYDVVIPYCMEENVDVWPCDLDGNLRPDPDAPYHLSPGRSVALRWGEKLTKEAANLCGIPERLAS